MSLPWHQQPWQAVMQRHQAAGLPHAMMLTGVAGIGKQQFAQLLAQWLLCSAAQPDAACGQCHSCQLWRAGNHPDYLHCGPEDGSQQIRIESIRRLNHFLSQTPQISSCQLVTLAPAEVMNMNAANALLKTLEEPPGESYLILSAERYGSVLPTIRSRCQRISMSAPTQQQGIDWLQQQGIDSNAALQALSFNPGAPLMAQRWVEDGTQQQLQQWQQQLLQWSQGQLGLTELAESWSKKQDFDCLCRWWLQLTVDTLKAQLGAVPEQLMFVEFIQQLPLLQQGKLDRQRLLALHSKLQSMVGRLASGAAHYNKQLTVETLLLDWRELVMTGQQRETA